MKNKEGEINIKSIKAIAYLSKNAFTFKLYNQKLIYLYN